ncbi:MAG: nitroreductase [Gammaproteobacteria bacterium]|nr:nitroreductase [Gammaproteobacteria bacterium]
MNPTLELLLTRRSVKAIDMIEPGPDAGQIETILRCGIRVPDHGKLGPWRILRFTGDRRRAFGEVLVAAWRAAHPDDAPARAELERGRLERAPVVLAVVSRITPEHKIPQWEQQLSAGAVCQNLLLASHAMGFAAQWLTEWFSYDATVARALHLSPHERLAGWIHIGSAAGTPPERPRPVLEDVVRDWQP